MLCYVTKHLRSRDKHSRLRLMLPPTLGLSYPSPALPPAWFISVQSTVKVFVNQTQLEEWKISGCFWLEYRKFIPFSRLLDKTWHLELGGSWVWFSPEARNLLNVSHYNKHLNTLWLVSRETVKFVFRESQCFPRLYSWKFIKPYCNGSRRSTFVGNNALFPYDVIDLQCCPLTDFGGKQFHC